jgi:transposase-like protein
MTPDLKFPKTLQQAIVYFSDPQRTHDYAVSLRWPEGTVTCPRCNSDKHSFISTRRIWFCKGCKKQFTIKVGTIFEDSAIGMDKWMIAVWLIANCKNGISSYEVSRALGVTQKSAWFMMHRIRLAMQTSSFVKLGGAGKEVEVDETFIGGRARNMHREVHRRKIVQGGPHDKTIVFGVLERGGQVRAKVLPNRRKPTIQSEVRNHVSANSALFSDKLQSYDGLIRDYCHYVVDHAERYVDGKVHTNGLENFWSLLKRGLKGTYVNVEPFHLFRYLDEQTFRYNNRATKQRPVNDGDRFFLAMNHIAGKRLTYEQLTGKGTDSVHQAEAGAGPS